MNENAPEILIATGNTGKVREIREALSSLPLRFRQLEDFPQTKTIDEVGTSYEENAALKALGYAKQTGMAALADDSGLEVDALDGKPGILSARLGGGRLTDKERIRVLLDQLANFTESKRTARFVCSMVLVGRPAGEVDAETSLRLLKTTFGICEGKVINEPRGHNGFGFDPVFVPNGHDQTFAELPADIKNRISHRGKALHEMRVFLEGWVRQT